MSVKSDRWIRKMALEHRMIEPFTETQVREGVISYGLSSYGYDVRIADEFKIFTNINHTSSIRRTSTPARSWTSGRAVHHPAELLRLARSVEYFRIPRNVITVCLGKSSYARCGIIVNVTPLEPEWEGIVTLESRTRRRSPPASTPGRGSRRSSLRGRRAVRDVLRRQEGKYQAQNGLTLPRL